MNNYRFYVYCNDKCCNWNMFFEYDYIPHECPECSSIDIKVVDTLKIWLPYG